MPAPLARLAHRVTDAPRYYFGGLWKRLFEMPVPVWCQALAFKALVTILPLILIATGVFGLILRQENPFETVAGYLRTFLPAGQSENLIRLLSELQNASGTITILGVLFFLGAIVTFFSALRYVVSTAMGGNRDTYRTILGGYAFDLRMVLQVGLLFLLSFGLTFFVNSLSETSTAVLADLGLDPELLKRGWRFTLRAMTVLVPFAISLAMFAQLYYFIPRPKPPSRSAFFGGFFAAVLFELAKNAFTLYARYFGRFDRYAGEAEDTLGSLGGIFGLLLAFVFWVYISGLILIVGALMARLHETRNRPERSRLRRVVRKVLAQKHRREGADAEAADLEAGCAEAAGPEEARAGAQEEPRRVSDDLTAPADGAGDGAARAPVPPPDTPSR